MPELDRSELSGLLEKSHYLKARVEELVRELREIDDRIMAIRAEEVADGAASGAGS